MIRSLICNSGPLRRLTESRFESCDVGAVVRSVNALFFELASHVAKTQPLCRGPVPNHQYFELQRSILLTQWANLGGFTTSDFLALGGDDDGVITHTAHPTNLVP